MIRDPTVATGTVDTSGVMTTAMMVDDAITTTMIEVTDMIDTTATTALVKMTDMLLAAVQVTPAAVTPVPPVAAGTNTPMMLVARSSKPEITTSCPNTAFLTP